MLGRAALTQDVTAGQLRPCCCRRNMRLRGMLEHEAGTPQLWAAPDAARTGPSAAAALAGEPLWELALLRKHYHPHVAQSAAVVAAIPPEGACMHCMQESAC